MQLNRPMPVLTTEPFRFDPLQQDRGFAQMFQQEMAVKSISQTETKAAMALTGAEESLLNHWSIPDYERIFDAPEMVMRETAADFERFEERARQVAHEMMRYDIQAMVDIRFGVGGITTNLNDNFLVSDLSMAQLWNVEQQIFGWGRDNARLVNAVGGLGLEHSLAKAVLMMDREQGLNRNQAAERGQLDGYVRQLLLTAGNTSGFNPLMPRQLETMGIDLLSAQGENINPRSATAAELRGAAQYMFQRAEVGIESFSFMMHAHQLTAQPEQAGSVDWISAFHGLSNSPSVYGDAKLHLVNTLAVLQRLAR